MNHEQINQFGLIDQYLMGKLSAEDIADFEEHFVGCPQCIAQLQTTKNFMQDLRFAAAEQVLQPDRHKPRNAFWHFLQTLFPKPVAWATICLLIAAGAIAFFVNGYVRRLQTEADQAKSMSEEWKRRYEDESQSAIAADRRHQETELQQAEQVRELESKLKNQEAQSAKMATDFDRQMRSVSNPLSFILNSVRSSNPNTSAPINQIKIPRSSVFFEFSISLEGEQRFESYHITIFDNDDRPIWEDQSLPHQDGSLSVTLRSQLFRPGRYYLLVEGIKKEGGRDVFGNYPFVIVKAR